MRACVKYPVPLKRNKFHALLDPSKREEEKRRIRRVFSSSSYSRPWWEKGLKINLEWIENKKKKMWRGRKVSSFLRWWKWYVIILCSESETKKWSDSIVTAAAAAAAVVFNSVNWERVICVLLLFGRNAACLAKTCRVSALHNAGRAYTYIDCSILFLFFPSSRHIRMLKQSQICFICWSQHKL